MGTQPSNPLAPAVGPAQQDFALHERQGRRAGKRDDGHGEQEHSLHGTKRRDEADGDDETVQIELDQNPSDENPKRSKGKGGLWGEEGPGAQGFSRRGWTRRDGRVLPDQRG